MNAGPAIKQQLLALKTHQNPRITEVNGQMGKLKQMERTEVAKAGETVKALQEKISDAIPVRSHNISLLRNQADDVDKSCFKAHIAKTTGASAAAVGSMLGIIGFGLAFCDVWNQPCHWHTGSNRW